MSATTSKQIIGSVSHSTMRSEDLIPRFLDVLEELDGQAAAEIRREHELELANLNGADEVTDEQWESLEYLLNETLFDLLNNYAPPYFYFGSHQGDGSDYGFWLSEESLEDFDGLKVNDTSDVPEDYQGEVLHVNDHGNCTLYTADGKGNLTEVWSLV